MSHLAQPAPPTPSSPLLAAPSKYTGRSSNELYEFCDKFSSDHEHLLLPMSDESYRSSPTPYHIVEGLRPAIVSQLFSAGFSLHGSTSTAETWNCNRKLIDSLYILSRMSDGNPEVIKQHSDHLNCLFSMTKISLEKVVAGDDLASPQSDFLASCLHLLEIYHDPKLRWRQWLELKGLELIDLFRDYDTKQGSILASSKSLKATPSILEGPNLTNWPSTPLKLNPDLLPWIFEQLVIENGSSTSTPPPLIRTKLLHLVGAMAAGNIVSPKLIAESPVVTECLAKLPRDEKDEEAEAVGQNINHRRGHLAAMTLVMLCMKIHHEHPNDSEARTALNFLLKRLLCLPDDEHRKRNDAIRVASLSAIHSVLWLRSDRSYLQSSLVNSFNQPSFVFDKILAIIESATRVNSDVAGKKPWESEIDRQDLVTLALRLLTAIFRSSSFVKDTFAQLVGYQRLHGSLKSAIPRPGREIFSCLFFAAFESKSICQGDSKLCFPPPTNLAIPNSGFLGIILDWLGAADNALSQEGVCQKLSAITNAPAAIKFGLIKNGFISKLIDSLKANIPLISSTPVFPTDKNQGMLSCSSAPFITERSMSSLISLVEHLGGMSISISEIKSFLTLVRASVYVETKITTALETPDHDRDHEAAFLFPRLLNSLCVMVNREGHDAAKTFFDLTKDSAGITVTGLKESDSNSATPTHSSLTSGFSVFTWVQLDQSCLFQHSYLHRRQLYAATLTSGCGLEAFFTPTGVLVIGVTSEKEFCTASVAGTPFTDANWHSVLVTHSIGRRPFGATSVHVYIDGTLKLSVPLKFPAKSGDSLSTCAIGWFGRRQTKRDEEIPTLGAKETSKSKLTSTAGTVFNTALNMSSSAAASVAARTPFSAAGGISRFSSNASSVSSTPIEVKDQVWGIPISLKGRLGQVLALGEVLQPAQVKILFSFSSPSAEVLNMFDTQPDLEPIKHRRLFHFHPKCTKDNVCTDLSSFSILGRLTGSVQQTQSLKEGLVGVGGLNVIFIMIAESAKWAERFPQWKKYVQNEVLDHDEDLLCGSIDSSDMPQDDKDTFRDDWTVLYSSPPLQGNDSNPVAITLNLLNRVIATSCEFQGYLSTNCIRILGSLLSKIHPSFVDASLLSVVQHFQETLAPYTYHVSQLLEHVVFDFEIWTKSGQTSVQILHLQYVAKLIRDDPFFYRPNFGALFFLDVIQKYFADESIVSQDSHCLSGTLRNGLFGLVKFLITSGITANPAPTSCPLEDLDALVAFIHSMASSGRFHLTLSALELLCCLIEETSCGESEGSIYQSGKKYSSLSNLSAHMQSMAVAPSATLSKAIYAASGTVKSLASASSSKPFGSAETGVTPPHTRPAPPPPASSWRLHLHRLLSEPGRADSLFAFLSPHYPLLPSSKKRIIEAELDSSEPSEPPMSPSSLPLSLAFPHSTSHRIPSAIVVAALRVIEALLDSSSTLNGRKSCGFCRDGITLEMVASLINWWRRGDIERRKEAVEDTEVETTTDGDPYEVLRRLSALILHPSISGSSAYPAFFTLLYFLPSGNLTLKRDSIRLFLLRILQSDAERKAANEEMLWPLALVKAIITQSSDPEGSASSSCFVGELPSRSEAGTTESTTANVNNATTTPIASESNHFSHIEEPAAYASSSPSTCSRGRSQSLIDTSSMLEFTSANKRASIVSDLHSATAMAWSGIHQVSSGFSNVIKQLPHQIYSASSLDVGGETAGDDGDDGDLVLSSDEEDDDSVPPQERGDLGEITNVSFAANEVTEFDRNHQHDVSQDQQLIVKKLDEMSLKKSAKSYQSARSLLFSPNAELLEIVSHSMSFVMWPDSTKEITSRSWQVLAALNKLHKRCKKRPKLVSTAVPAYAVCRRLLEILLERSLATVASATEAGSGSVGAIASSITIVKIVHRFCSGQIFRNVEEPFSETLLMNVCCLFDALAVWDEGLPGMEWTEMARLGLSLLLKAAGSKQLVICSLASAKLHTLVQVRPLQSKEEICFLLYQMNKLLVDSPEDNYAFLLPVMKTLLSQAEDLLGGFVYHIPNLPSPKLNSMFHDEFQVFSQTDEWKEFLKEKVKPRSLLYERSILQNEVNGKQKTHQPGSETKEPDQLSLSCCGHVETVLVEARFGILKALRSLQKRHIWHALKIKELILAPLSKDVIETSLSRYHQSESVKRHNHLLCLHEWANVRRCLVGARGCWHDGITFDGIENWKLAPNENYSRMRTKLLPDLLFDPHTDASNLRDNIHFLGAGSTERVQSEASSFSVESESSMKLLRRFSEKNAGQDGNKEENQLVESELSKLTASDQKAGSNPEDTSRVVMTTDAVRIVMMESYSGILTLSSSSVSFKVSAGGSTSLAQYNFCWCLDDLREVHFRRFNLRRTALEFFLTNQTTYFMNFPATDVRSKIYSKILAQRPPSLLSYNVRSPADLLKSSGLTQKWVNREITNFEYLIQLNTIAGRSYNDLSQYPVFPWILQNYTSSRFEIDDPTYYRDLSCPVGAVNPRNRVSIRDKFRYFEDPTGSIPKFHYGTHYSNPAGVLHYLIRLEPFTKQHIQLQSGRFDVADRQFHSIASTWESLYDTPNDVKELTPEFFYLPEFLLNINGFDLGKLQFSKGKVDDVILPNWAKDAEDFIYKHRNALESEIVSAQLHHWIDLIFGYKQRGEAAIEALNVFYHCTYEGAIELDAIADPNERKAVESMINNFGQTPSQLLKDPHPKRFSLEEAACKAETIDRPLSVFNFLNKLKAFFVEITLGDSLVAATLPRFQSDSRGFMQSGIPDTLITVSKNQSHIGIHGWLPYDRAISNYFTFEPDPSLSNHRLRRSLGFPRHPDLAASSSPFNLSQTVVVSHDAKIIFSAGYWDNSIRIWSLPKTKTINHIVKHLDVVTCLALDATGSVLMSGSKDFTSMLWSVKKQAGVTIGITNTIPLHVLTGHNAPVTCVSIVTELDMAASGSLDGSAIIYAVKDGLSLYTIQPRPSADVSGLRLSVISMTISDERHIVLYCRESTSACVTSAHISPSSIPSTSTKHFLHSYSINNKFLKKERLPSGVGALVTSGQHVLVGHANGQLVIKELHELRTVTSLPLHVGISSLAVTTSQTHILVGLEDGRLIVVGTDRNCHVKKSLIG